MFRIARAQSAKQSEGGIILIENRRQIVYDDKKTS
jgi:hypothetical protein